MAASKMCWSLILLAITIQRTEPSGDAMKYISSGFVKVLEQCKQELNLPDHILGDLFHFWKLEYDLLNRDTGCIIICMSKKLDLIDASGKLHHGNAKEFAVKHGAGEEVATKLVSALHECETKNDGNTDDCLRTLEMAKCFRTIVHDLNWTPKVEYIVEELNFVVKECLDHKGSKEIYDSFDSVQCIHFSGVIGGNRHTHNTSLVTNSFANSILKLFKSKQEENYA